MTEPTIKELIREEHRRAELARFDAGLPGCGCLDCQELYRTLDLSKYGDRVKHYGGFILIIEKSRQNTDRDTLQNGCQRLPVKQGRVTKIKADKILVLATQQASNRIMLQANGEPKRGRGRPAKPGGEPVSRMTHWRRRQAEEK